MSRLYEALKRLEPSDSGSGIHGSATLHPAELLNSTIKTQELEGSQQAKLNVPAKGKLVALTEPRGIGADKFRALATRLQNIRQQHELKSFQVTSSVVNEGKSLVAANVAVTLAMSNKTRVLLIEGDLHRPNLGSLFGLSQVKGLSEWWSEPEQDLTSFLYRLDDMPLWFLSAGKIHEQPSYILQSARLCEALTSLAAQFEWVVVDSTPMLPIVDASLWSRLVDGTVLVVREGLTPVNILKKGLESLDNLKLIGVVLNDASESDHAQYQYSYRDSKKK